VAELRHGAFVNLVYRQAVESLYLGSESRHRIQVRRNRIPLRICRRCFESASENRVPRLLHDRRGGGNPAGRPLWGLKVAAPSPSSAAAASRRPSPRRRPAAAKPTSLSRGADGCAYRPFAEDDRSRGMPPDVRGLLGELTILPAYRSHTPKDNSIRRQSGVRLHSSKSQVAGHE